MSDALNNTAIAAYEKYLCITPLSEVQFFLDKDTFSKALPTLSSDSNEQPALRVIVTTDWVSLLWPLESSKSILGHFLTALEDFMCAILSALLI